MKVFEKCSSVKDCMHIVNSLPDQSKDLVLWILQLMALVSEQSSTNLMNANNCATLVAPNLFSMEDLIVFDRMLPFVTLFCTLLISSFQEFSVCCITMRVFTVFLC